jgi:hypothetical protein
VIVKLLDRQDVSAGDFTSKKDAFREELMSARRNRFYANYMTKVKLKMQIEVNPDVIQRVIDN